MKNWSRILIGITASLAVSLLIASGIFWILQGMNREAARGRVYDQIINKTHALNQLSAKYEGEPDKGYIHQITEVHNSLGNLLAELTSVDSSEGLLIRQIRASNEDLGYSLNRLIAASTDKEGNQAKRKNVLTSQLWLKTQFILDDTYRLVELNSSRIESAQVQTVTLVILLVFLLIFINAAISFISARSTVRAEAETRKQREWLNVTLSSIGDAVIATDTSGRVSFINPVAAGLTGWSENEAWGKPADQVFRVIDEKTREPGSNIFKTVLDNGQIITLSNNTALIARDGREIPIEDSAAPIRDETGQPIGVVLVFHDVTEKRRAQEALRNSEAKYRNLFENMTEEVHFWQLVKDEAGRIKTWRLVDANPPTLKTWGRASVDEIKGKTTDEIFGAGATEHYLPVVEKIMTEGAPFAFEDYFPHLDKYFRFTSVPLGDYFITTGADFTSIKKAENALRESEQRLRIATEAAKIGAFDWSIQTGVNIWTPELEAMYGLAPGEFGRTQPAWEQMVHPDDRAGAVAKVEETLETGEPVEHEWRIIWRDGSVHWIAGRFQGFKDAAGKPLRLTGVNMDITSRKQVETALEAERARLQAVLDSLPVAVWIGDHEGTVIQTNGAVENIWGKPSLPYGLRKYKEYKGWWADTGQPLAAQDWALARAILKGEVSTGEIIDIERFNGDRGTILNNAAPVRDSEGRIIGGVAVAQDITERKRAEEALRQSQRTFAESIERAPFGIYVVDARFRIAHMNASSQEGAFRNVRPVIGRDFTEAMRILWPEEVAREIIGVFRHTLETGEPYYSPRFINPRADVGQTESYEWELHRMTLPDGQYGVICYYYDSTKLREAEAAVCESEERLRFSLESCRIGAWDIDLEDHTAYRSLEHDRIFGYQELLPSWTLEDFLKHALPEYRAPVEAMVHEATAGKTGWTHECKIRRVDGEVRWIWFSGQHRTDSSGRSRVAGVVQDITERKQAEEALKASLTEKEVLLNEIHHRVKNNMQVISSLVSLQADEVEDAAMGEILQEVSHRVRSMALVHEKLYQSADLARVEFAEYTESLLGYLWRAHGSAASRVRLALDLEPVSLPVDTAVPCGLILNELVVNALKHAFHGHDGGEVSVVLRGDTDSKVRLCVRDDGIGLPEGFDWQQARSLGLHLVQMLSRQLRATVKVSSIEGTEFEITFKGSKT